MNRHTLDTFTARRRLGATAIAAALDLTGARPVGAEWRAFAATLLHAAGLAAVGAGALFFVAANWQALGLLGRFALLQAALLAGVVAALWRPPPAPLGRAALLLATLLVGGLLALFGQSYQTGADLHELFFIWALLALPFALAAAWGALWAVWFVVLNVGMALLCGWLGPDHVVWLVVDGWGRGRATTLLLPCLVNLLAAGGFNLLRGGRLAAAAPLWLVRLLASVGFVYGTWAAIDAATGSVNSDSLGGVFGISAGVDAGTATLALWALIVSAIAARTWQRRRDVFPMALVAASAIAVSTAWLAHAVRLDGAGSLFLLALWLIAASTGAGLLLMHWVRAWRIAPLTEGAAA